MNTLHPGRTRGTRMTGFTLVELMVTISIATILMMVATPSYRQFISNAQLSEAVNEFVSAVNAARGNAIKQGRNTYLKPLDGANWSSGWRVYADVNWDGVYTAGTDELVLESAAPSSELTITTPTGSTLASGYLLFNGSGYPKIMPPDTGKIQMKNAYRTSIVNIDNTGRVRSCSTTVSSCI